MVTLWLPKSLQRVSETALSIPRPSARRTRFVLFLVTYFKHREPWCFDVEHHDSPFDAKKMDRPGMDCSFLCGTRDLGYPRSRQDATQDNKQ